MKNKTPVCTDDAAAVCIAVSQRSVTFADVCLPFAEMKHRAACWVIREAVIQEGDRETLGFDCRLVYWAQEPPLALPDRDIK